MRYRLVEKFWSLFGDAFDIRDGDGRQLYRVRRQKSGDAERLAFEDPGELEVASVISEPGDRWRLTCGGQDVAVVAKEVLSALGWQFVIEAPGLDREIRRERSGFAITAGGAEVASVRQTSSLFRNAFAVELAPGIEPLVALASAVVIAMCDRS